MPRVAVLDSDSGFVKVLGRRLDGAGIEHTVHDRPVSLDDLATMRLSAVIVDPAVVGADGQAYLEALCERLPHLGIVVCTGPTSVALRARMLRLGADDWMTKPCHADELAARVEAVARRQRLRPAMESEPLLVGELEIRADRYQAFVAGRPAGLTRREFELIQLLASAQGAVLTREELYERVWGYAMSHGERAVDVLVRKLRMKLERLSPGWRYIHTHVGVGYRLAAEPVTGSPPIGRRFSKLGRRR